eukprot:383977-Pelagomonas_calceolata.AAC.3
MKPIIQRSMRDTKRFIGPPSWAVPSSFCGVTCVCVCVSALETRRSYSVEPEDSIRSGRGRESGAQPSTVQQAVSLWWRFLADPAWASSFCSAAAVLVAPDLSRQKLMYQAFQHKDSAAKALEFSNQKPTGIEPNAEQVPCEIGAKNTLLRHTFALHLGSQAGLGSCQINRSKKMGEGNWVPKHSDSETPTGW